MQKFQHICERIMDSILSHPLAGPFITLAPDHESQLIPKMNLQLIKIRLVNHQYPSVESWKKDIELLFESTSSKPQLNSSALYLLLHFNKACKRLLPQHSPSFFNTNSLIGQGLSKVFLAYTSDNSPIAAKRFRSSYDFANEFAMHSFLQSHTENTVVQKVDEDIDKLTLYLEYLPPLIDFINNSNYFSFCDRKDILIVLLRTIQSVQNFHSIGYVHGDLKIPNIVVDFSTPTPTLKLIDFGFSQESTSGRPKGFSLGYFPPELLRTQNIDQVDLTKIDLYALGVLSSLLFLDKQCAHYYFQNIFPILNDLTSMEGRLTLLDVFNHFQTLISLEDQDQTFLNQHQKALFYQPFTESYTTDDLFSKIDSVYFSNTFHPCIGAKVGVFYLTIRPKSSTGNDYLTFFALNKQRCLKWVQKYGHPENINDISIDAYLNQNGYNSIDSNSCPYTILSFIFSKFHNSQELSNYIIYSVPKNKNYYPLMDLIPFNFNI